MVFNQSMFSPCKTNRFKNLRTCGQLIDIPKVLIVKRNEPPLLKCRYQHGKCSEKREATFNICSLAPRHKAEATRNARYLHCTI